MAETSVRITIEETTKQEVEALVNTVGDEKRGLVYNALLQAGLRTGKSTLRQVLKEEADRQHAALTKLITDITKE